MKWVYVDQPGSPGAFGEGADRPGLLGTERLRHRYAQATLRSRGDLLSSKRPTRVIARPSSIAAPRTSAVIPPMRRAQCRDRSHIVAVITASCCRGECVVMSWSCPIRWRQRGRADQHDRRPDDRRKPLRAYDHRTEAGFARRSQPRRHAATTATRLAMTAKRCRTNDVRR